jgi:hypothetical protein
MLPDSEHFEGFPTARLLQAERDLTMSGGSSYAGRYAASPPASVNSAFIVCAIASVGDRTRIRAPATRRAKIFRSVSRRWEQWDR